MSAKTLVNAGFIVGEVAALAAFVILGFEWCLMFAALLILQPIAVNAVSKTAPAPLPRCRINVFLNGTLWRQFRSRVVWTDADGSFCHSCGSKTAGRMLRMDLTDSDSKRWNQVAAFCQTCADGAQEGEL